MGVGSFFFRGGGQKWWKFRFSHTKLRKKRFFWWKFHRKTSDFKIQRGTIPPALPLPTTMLTIISGMRFTSCYQNAALRRNHRSETSPAAAHARSGHDGESSRLQKAQAGMLHWNNVCTKSEPWNCASKRRYKHKKKEGAGAYTFLLREAWTQLNAKVRTSPALDSRTRDSLKVCAFFRNSKYI